MKLCTIYKYHDILNPKNHQRSHMVRWDIYMVLKMKKKIFTIVYITENDCFICFYFVEWEKNLAGDNFFGLTFRKIYHLGYLYWKFQAKILKSEFLMIFNKFPVKCI